MVQRVHVQSGDYMENEQSSEGEAALEELLRDQEGEENAGPAALAQSYSTTSRTALTPADDPSTPPYPRGLVLDLALRTAPVVDILDAYHMSVAEFKALTQHPVFRRDMVEMREKIKEDGFSFKVKVQAQAEAYLGEAWKLVHDKDTPSNVRADLIKWTAKLAGYEQMAMRPPTSGAEMLPQLAEQLKSMPDGELEMKVMSLVLRNAKQTINTAPSANTYDAA